MTYYLWKAPKDKMPEASGYGITILPGFGQWILIHNRDGIVPPRGAVPVKDVVNILETL